MKIKIKIPNDNRWPAQYFGKEVEVEVQCVVFPDAGSWACEGYPAEVVLPLPEVPIGGLPGLLGQRVKMIEFMEDKNERR